MKKLAILVALAVFGSAAMGETTAAAAETGAAGGGATAQVESDFRAVAAVPCWLKAASEHYFACESGEVFSADILNAAESANSAANTAANTDDNAAAAPSAVSATPVLNFGEGLKFIDDYDGKVLALLERDGRAQIALASGGQITRAEANSAALMGFIARSGVVVASSAGGVEIYDFALQKRAERHFGTASIAAAAVLADRSGVALGDEGGSVILLNATGEKIASAEVFKDKINCLAASRAGLIAGSTDRTAAILGADLSVQQRLEADSLVYFCALSDGGAWAYSCDAEGNLCTSGGLARIGNEYLNSIYFRGERLGLNAYSREILEAK